MCVCVHVMLCVDVCVEIIWYDVINMAFVGGVEVVGAADLFVAGDVVGDDELVEVAGDAFGQA